jgi:hypothetical protein
MPKKMSQRLPALAVFLVCVLWCAAPRLLWAQQVSISFQAVPREVVAQRLQRLRSKNAEREAELKKIFGEAGCKPYQVQEQIVSRNDPPNVTCTLPGSANSLIIVGAHFDKALTGSGAVDDWSGASLLPSLYQGLQDSPRRHTFMFVGFTDEEEGAAGSTFFVAHLPEDRLSAIKAMVNLQCLGLASTKVSPRLASKELLGPLVSITKAMNADLKAVNVALIGNDDTLAFREKKLPVITIHSLTEETLPIINTPRDDLTAIHLDKLYEAYTVITEYLAYIDEVLD